MLYFVFVFVFVFINYLNRDVLSMIVSSFLIIFVNWLCLFDVRCDIIWRERHFLPNFGKLKNMFLIRLIDKLV